MSSFCPSFSLVIDEESRPRVLPIMAKSRMNMNVWCCVTRLSAMYRYCSATTHVGFDFYFFRVMLYYLCHVPKCRSVSLLSLDVEC